MLRLKQVHELYERLRLLYFMEAPEPLHVPPPASDLRWYWLPPGSPLHGATHIDEDGDADSLGLDPYLRRSRRFLTHMLLHELTHIRDPLASCAGRTGTRSARWRREQARLASLGAPLL